VVGLDPSRAMLRLARERVAGPLVLGDGERLPFRDKAFDLAALSSVLHWLSEQGVGEVARVLRPHGFLVAYDVWFLARMQGEPAFTEWMHGMSKRYPQVAKAEHGKDEMREAGLEHISRGDLERWITMDMQTLCDYLMTHSERLAAVHHGRETEVAQRDFLLGGLGQFFGHHTTRDVGFGLAIDLYERV
jgi:ubiquinone/menaquinone biosynthesis C-methylase UbiE